ncbi:MAG: IclR family transcriptional regulator [Thermodesulfobacteriota bacterium]
MLSVTNRHPEKRRKEANRHIDVVQKAIDILDIFDSLPEASLKQIAELAKITSNRAIRILGTLESKGYVSWNPESRIYRLGYRALALGKAFEKHNDLASISRPVLKGLVEACGESASLFVVSGGSRMVLAREEGTHDIRFAISEGQRVPLHAGAGGKVLLAFGTKRLLESITSKRELRAFTPSTFTNKDKLLKELSIIRDKGYAISKGERVPDSKAIAAPVFDHEDRLVGALGIAGPASRFTGEELEKRLNLVIKAAQSLSCLLGRSSTHDGFAMERKE